MELIKVGAGGRTHLLLALVIRPLTTHPFRDGAAPPLLLIETYNIWGVHDVLFIYVWHRKNNVLSCRGGGGGLIKFTGATVRTVAHKPSCKAETGVPR